MNKFIILLFASLIFLIPYTADASSLLCAVTEATECDMDGCQKVTAEDMNITPFVRVDLQDKMISTVGGKEDKRESAFRNYKKADGKIIIQGDENGRAWSMVIEEDSGKMSATVSEEEVGFVVFGACIAD
jgi:hypothetical protein